MVRLMPAGDPGVYELRIQGDRFLYKMARNLAGALVKVTSNPPPLSPHCPPGFACQPPASTPFCLPSYP